DWIDVYSTTIGDGTDDYIIFDSPTDLTTRYVRMLSTERGAGENYSLWEFEVIGKLTHLAITTATASSSEGPDMGPEKAIDEDLTTRWSSNFNNNEWLYIDFGAARTFSTVVLNWEAAYGKQYQIQISDDAQNWTTIYTETNSNGGIDSIAVGEQVARYVKMQGIQKATSYGYSLWEFGVSEDAPQITATASSSEYPDLGPEKAIDGDYNTRWSSNHNHNEWLCIDFGAAKTFSTVVLNWEAAYGKSYELQISDDAQNWTTIYTEDNSDGGTDSIAVGEQTVRYLKMQGIQRATDWGYSLWEFSVQ
ncbi:MAG: discoidin domain-containing protein, partial [Candidatus Omnitrophota bacterium]|nr:discoidin domain-containing protein [Candidatus Omnitrophota bacterium]